MKKKSGILMMAVMLFLASFTVRAMENGAYLAPRTTSYVNPDTNETMDGGTNIALGQSMCDSIVDDQVLVEKTDDSMYVTIGLGLMSNVSDVSMKVVNEKGEFRDVDLTLTGSCERDGDTCNHYRFEMKPEDKYFSPVLFVTPMGREVQFFVSIDYDSMQEGTGNFLSEMLEKKPEPKVTKEEVSQEKETSKKSEPKEEAKKQDYSTWIFVGVAAVVLVGAGAIILKKKRG